MNTVHLVALRDRRTGEGVSVSDIGVQPVTWGGDHLRLLDQTLLPLEERYLELRDHAAVAEAITAMRVRGAPAIGVTAAYGMALAARESTASDLPSLLRDLTTAMERLGRTRPTAVNLFWALERVQAVARTATSVEHCRALLLAEAIAIEEADVAACRAMGEHGAALIPDDATILTHCNAGALATAGYGTALGVVRAAWAQGKLRRVIADETRPLLQGARLTAWELTRAGIPTTLIADTMAGSMMQRGIVSCVVVGADRIAANGDVANKIGTYQVAVLAREHSIPLYVAAPTSTLDLSLAHGGLIPIEERGAGEVRGFGGVQTAPDAADIANPAFDVTPARFITAIITEQGVARAPFESALRAMVNLTPRPPSLAGKGAPRAGVADVPLQSLACDAQSSLPPAIQGTPFPRREGGRGVRFDAGGAP